MFITKSIAIYDWYIVTFSGKKVVEREAAALRDLHREDGHPEVMILFPDSQIILFPVSSRGMFLVAVALSSNHVLIYNDKNVVDCFQTDDAVSAMKFGRFGREENTLVIGKHGCYQDSC